MEIAGSCGMAETFSSAADFSCFHLTELGLCHETPTEVGVHG